MTPRAWVAVAAAGAVAPGCAGQPAPIPERPGWRLVWHDEFDGPTLDAGKWRVEHAALVKNQELQFYTEDEVYLEDGCLVLRSRERDLGGRAYTSGLVDTQDRFAQVFGRFEVRAQLPKGQGIWPAHWMLPEDHPAWPPELDIMESLGHEPDTVHCTQHWGTWPNNASRGTHLKADDFSAGFHTFALEWSPDRLDWFVDDRLAFTSTGEVPQIPFYLILNTAVGGQWPGNPDDTTVFPQMHRIDHVRVYERADTVVPLLQTRSPHGRVALDPDRHVFELGEVVTATAEPAFGYRFTGWEGLGEAESVRLVMDGPRTLEARFEPDPALHPRLQPAGAVASSAESEWVGPEFAVDGLPGTRWASAGEDPQTLTIDLGGLARVQTVRVVWENARPGDWELGASSDGQLWRTMHRASKADAAPDVIAGPTEPVRYLRVTAESRATPWGISIWEFEAYGRLLGGASDGLP